jgi:hypothetical protein
MTPWAKSLLLFVLGLLVIASPFAIIEWLLYVNN